MKDRNEPLYPEEEMMIEQKALEAFLESAEYGKAGIEHFQNYVKGLAQRMSDYENK